MFGLWRALREWWDCQCCPNVRRHRAYCGTDCIDFKPDSRGEIHGECRGCRSCKVHAPKPQLRLIISEGPYR